MRETTRQLLDCIFLDMAPSYAVCTDFGMDKSNGMQVFGALQWAIKRDICSSKELDEACGDGEKLTELVNRTHMGVSNPYKTTISTAYDDLPPEDEE
jgi:hypothetical protein